jgi:hypothetical protein
MRITVKATALALSHFVLSLAPCSLAFASDAAGDKPPDRFVDAGACPFECCTYRQWTVHDSINLLDRPNGTRVVGSARRGETVQGLTGEVISTPVAVKADRQIPDTAIKPGDIFYVLHYEGEGDWKIWFRGKTESVDQSFVNVPKPKAEWWVKIKNRAGVVGWTLSNGQFLHQDACE